jgi:hypothetical protein
MRRRNYLLIVCFFILVLVSISTGLPNHSASIQLCVQKLRILIEDSDQNRKKSNELIS